MTSHSPTIAPWFASLQEALGVQFADGASASRAIRGANANGFEAVALEFAGDGIMHSIVRLAILRHLVSTSTTQTFIYEIAQTLVANNYWAYLMISRLGVSRERGAQFNLADGFERLIGYLGLCLDPTQLQEICLRLVTPEVERVISKPAEIPAALKQLRQVCYDTREADSKREGLLALMVDLPSLHTLLDPAIVAEIVVNAQREPNGRISCSARLFDREVVRARSNDVRSAEQAVVRELKKLAEKGNYHLLTILCAHICSLDFQCEGRSAGGPKSAVIHAEIHLAGRVLVRRAFAKGTDTQKMRDSLAGVVLKAWKTTIRVKSRELKITLPAGKML